MNSDGGILLEGKYRLIDELGRGGMGTVFRARDESLERLVAVKFLLPELQTEKRLVERFRREARAMASVRHENVLQIFTFGRYGAACFFVMEYIEGHTAEELIIERAKKRKELAPIERVLTFLEQAASGLAAVHRAGVVHRDVKPANIMVENGTKRAVIMDFGIGKRYSPGDTRRTQSPTGTPAYMAPEVVSGKEISAEEDHLSDIYAFGVTAFELLTGELPFEAESWVDLCVKHLTEPAPAPSSRRSQVPEYIDKISQKCLNKDPSDRYSSCDELRSDLVDAIERFGRRTVTPLPPSRRPTKTASRTPNGTIDTTDSPRVVVSDPDASFRNAVYQSAHEVFTECLFQAARTNSKAIQIALEAPPLVMVASLDDPGLNGLELAASLWGNIELEGVHLVLTAERITAGERRMLGGLGVHNVLLKPANSEELDEIFRTVARRAYDQLEVDSFALTHSRE